MDVNEIEALKVSVGTVLAENAALKERVRLLEERAKSAAWVRLTMPLLILALLLLSFSHRKTVNGSWLSVDDNAGHTRVWLDQGGLVLKDNKGVVRAKLGLSPGGEPFLHLFDSKHQLRANLSVYRPDDAAYLMMWDREGKGVRFPASKIPQQ